MKKLLLLVLLVSACSQKSTIEENIADYVKQNFHNPESYEPVVLGCIDTLMESDKMELKLAELNFELSSAIARRQNDSVELEQRKQFTILYSKSEIADAAQDLLADDSIIAVNQRNIAAYESEIESFKKSPQDTVTGYLYVHQYRARVPIGGLMLKSATIQTDQYFNITKFDEE